MSRNTEIWDGLIGGDRAKRILKSSLKYNHIVHNYLFEGPMGIGKLPFAFTFAQCFVCRESDSTQACGKCDDCRLFMHGRHPDVLVLSRENELTADEAREVNNLVMLSPQRTDRRIVILDGIDKINTTAANILLKTLEEAPADSIFLLTTHRPEKLLPTILSRSLRIPFQLLHSEALARAYMDIIGVDEETARQAAELSGGRPGWGIRFILHPEFRGLYKYGREIISQNLLGESLTKIFNKEKRIIKFLDESVRIFSEQDMHPGLNGFGVAKILNGEKVEFNPVNLFLDEEKEPTKRHLDALGFVLLGGIFRGMIDSGEIERKPERDVRLMEAFLEAPRQIERYFNRELVIERFVLYAHGRFGV